MAEEPGPLVPRPDPTSLTRDAIEEARDHTDREIRHLKELVEQRVNFLEQLVDQRFTSQERAVAAAVVAADAAIDKGEANAERWRSSANEWRGAMNDRERDFLRQDAYNRAHEELVHRVDDMNRTITEKLEDAKKTLHDKIDVLAQRVSDIATLTGGPG